MRQAGWQVAAVGWLFAVLVGVLRMAVVDPVGLVILAGLVTAAVVVVRFST